MNILKTTDKKDGSVVMDIELTKEEANFFIELGINKALKDSIEMLEKELYDPAYHINEPPKPKPKKRGGIKR